MDPAFAPGTGTPQVGGLSSVQILELVRALKGLNLVGCDLVEVSPPFDSAEITSLLAANLLFEQVNGVVPSGTQTGAAVPVTLTIDGQTSPLVTLAIQ